jgi:TonB family protein
MSEAVADIAAGRGRQFRGMVALSAGLHVALSLAFVLGPWRAFDDHEIPAGSPDITIITPQELAAMTGNARPAPKPPQPEPESEPIAEPPPPPPPPTEQIIIPEDAHRKPSPAKPKPAEAREPAPPRREPAPVEQVDLDDLLIEERILSGGMPGEPTPQAKPQALPGAGGTGAPMSAEVAAWQAKVRAHVRRNWALTPGLRGKGLKTRVNVELTASGLILDHELERSSGNPWFDESVDRFLEDAGSLPPPPDSGEWPIEFNGDF